MTTLGTYAEWLNELLKSRPELKEVQVITSGDDEGNYFNTVHYNPTPGYYDGGDFDVSPSNAQDINAVCLN